MGYGSHFYIDSLIPGAVECDGLRVAHAELLDKAKLADLWLHLLGRRIQPRSLALWAGADHLHDHDDVVLAGLLHGAAPLRQQHRCSDVLCPGKGCAQPAGHVCRPGVARVRTRVCVLHPFHHLVSGARRGLCYNSILLFLPLQYGLRYCFQASTPSEHRVMMQEIDSFTEDYKDRLRLITAG